MKTKLSILVSFLLFSFASKSYAHCEVPCGIYNDQLRVQLLLEHFTTIEKAMKQIDALSKKESVNYNQLVSWINTKEEHANKIQHIVFQYFMTQRIKVKQPENPTSYNKYIRQLTLAHKMLVASIKTKQTTDVKHIKTLRKTLHEFTEAYFNKADIKYLKEHFEHTH